MNEKLKEFLDLTVSPDPIRNNNGFLAQYKINDKDLQLNAGYSCGGAYISGIAFGRSIKVSYNYYLDPDNFKVNIDGKDLESTVSKFALTFFFTNGTLLGHPDQPHILRLESDMNWYIWEAVMTDLETLYSLRLVSQDLMQEALDIRTKTGETLKFSSDLRTRACNVEHAVEQFRKELVIHYEKEHVKYLNESLENTDAGINVEKMNYPLWLKTLGDLSTLIILKLATDELRNEGGRITSVMGGGGFTQELRVEAYRVKEEIEKYRKEIDDYNKAEDLDR